MPRGITNNIPGTATQTVWQNKQLILRQASQLAATTNGLGASLVGIEDAATNFTGTTVEDALAELAAGIGITDVTAAAATELTIAGGIVTATQTYHTIDTEADAASDDLDTVNGLADGQFYIFQNVNAGRNVVVKHGTGNIINPSGRDITLDVTNDKIFAFSNGVSLFVLDMSLATPTGGGLASALASVAAAQGASLVGIQDALTLYAATTVEAALAEVRTTALVKAATGLTIAGGIITATQSYHTVDTEGAAASDDIDTINGLTDGGVYLFRLADITHNVVFKNATGNIFCPAGFDVTLDVATDCVLVLGVGVFAVVVAFKTAATNGGGTGSALASVANGFGASLVGVEDAGAYFTGANVETTLAEVGLERVSNTIADPGNAGAIPVTRSGTCPLTSAGAGETRTLAAPSFVNQVITIVHAVDGGDIAIAVATTVNQAGNTTITMSEVDDAIGLIAVKIAAGALRWRVMFNDGGVLT